MLKCHSNHCYHLPLVSQNEPRIEVLTTCSYRRVPLTSREFDAVLCFALEMYIQLYLQAFIILKRLL